ncbi:ComEA family DNA-binding protein [Gracilimonas sp. Q87]|uniref:ComEA family DNA-binding protein n=1 Tax=Gracilimonas sp. Q87 TaxID=3384766 RepID=UPI0039843D35
MKLQNFKRKAFFWIDKLQITRKERTSFSLLLLILCLLLISSLFIEQKLNYQQEEYDEILELFEERTQLAEREKAAIAQKYNPDFTVNNAGNPDTETAVEQKSATALTEMTDSPSEVSETKPAIININTAGSDELQTLNGIGPAYAGRIIEYREANGGFKTIEELINVKGIGEKRLEAIRPFVTLDP